MQSFSIGDTVKITDYGKDSTSKYNGRVGPITNIVMANDGVVNYFIDIKESGFFFRGLICYEGEFEHAKEETNE